MNRSLAFQLRLLAARLEEKRDIHNSPYLSGRKEPLSQSEAFKILKTMYKDYRVRAEHLPEGLAYYVDFPMVGRTLVGDYHIDRQELIYRVYPGIKAPK